MKNGTIQVKGLKRKKEPNIAFFVKLKLNCFNQKSEYDCFRSQTQLFYHH